MILKGIKITLLSLLLLIVVYLALVVIWASLSVDDLLNKEAVRYSSTELTTEQVSVLLKIEDPRFYKHSGVDLSQGQGLTTITSSITRDIFLFGHKLDGVKGSFQHFYAGVFQCCKKIDIGRDFMAIVLNQHLTKNQQLSLFISTVYMGSYKGTPVIGLAHAAEIYYAKSLPQLSPQEFIGLVAMIKAPNHFDSLKNPNAHQARVDRIEHIISGNCHPNGWFDTTYAQCGAAVQQ